MSESQGCTNDRGVVESFMEALKQRVGTDRYRMWFTHGVSFDQNDSAVIIRVAGPFALERITKNFTRELRSAASSLAGTPREVQLELASETPTQRSLLPDADAGVESPSCNSEDANTNTLTRTDATPPVHPKRRRARSGATSSFGKIPSSSVPSPATRSSTPGSNSNNSSQLTLDLSTQVVAKPQYSLVDFIEGRCNHLATAAARMVCQDPRSATPLFLYGSGGVGKTHLLYAIADHFRRHHRMRSVMVLSAEQFTNDFVNSVGATGLPAFRRRFREVDALLVDDVHFLDSKRATLREMLFTVEAIVAAGRPLVFTANQSPMEIAGLTTELAGRLAAGLICPLQPFDAETRKRLIQRLITATCPLPWPEEMLDDLNAQLGGDARMIRGVVNLVGMLQRMYLRMPTMSEIRQFGGQLLRGQAATITLASIERAVCGAFELQQNALRSDKQSRDITQPRALAMYLSRQLTGAAYNEIARFYNQKSHTSALLALKKVEQWIETGKPIGRGPSRMSTADAVQQIESAIRAS
jgi:chromosomal replication initiator protein